MVPVTGSCGAGKASKAAGGSLAALPWSILDMVRLQPGRTGALNEPVGTEQQGVAAVRRAASLWALPVENASQVHTCSSGLLRPGVARCGLICVTGWIFCV